MSLVHSFDTIPAHRDADKWREGLPDAGTVLPDGRKVIRAKVASAFWITEHVLIKGAKVAPNVLMRRSPTCGTVLHIVEVTE